MSVTVSTIQHPVQQATQPSRLGSIVKHAAIGGVVGAAAGAGLSLTALPFIGALSAPIAAAIGGAAGIVVGGLVGFFRSRGSSDGARVGAGTIQTPPPAPSGGTGGTPPPPPPLPRS